MTPKEKAEELVMEFIPMVYDRDRNFNYSSLVEMDNAKKCAYILIRDIIVYEKQLLASGVIRHQDRLEFWQNVRDEVFNV